MKLVKVILFFLIFSFAYRLQAQGKIDSIVRKHLIEQKDLDKPVKEIKKIKGKKTSLSNYFVDENQTIKIEDKVYIKSYVFGSYSDHSPHYLLLQIIEHASEKQWILGSKTFEEELSILISLLKKETDNKINQSQIAKLVNYLTKCYM